MGPVEGISAQRLQKALRIATSLSSHFSSPEVIMRIILDVAADIVVAGNVPAPEQLFKECLQDARKRVKKDQVI